MNNQLPDLYTSLKAVSSPFRVSIDWFAFSYNNPSYSNMMQLSAFLDDFPFLKDFYHNQRKIVAAGNHYQYQIIISDGITLSWDETNDKGVCFSVSGSKLGLLYKWFPEISLAADPFRMLLEIIDAHFSRPSRVDIAFDDYDKVYRPLDYFFLDCENRIVSPYRSSRLFNNRSTLAKTFQLGKRSSGSHCRVYDKDIESNGDIDAVRYEFELHGKTCRDFCSTYLNEGRIDYRKFFLERFKVNAVDFEKSSYKYKYNVPIDSEWNSFINLKFNAEYSNIEIKHVIEDSSPERVLKNAISVLKSAVIYCSSIPKSVLYTLAAEIVDQFGPKDFEKANRIRHDISRFFDYNDIDII